MNRRLMVRKVAYLGFLAALNIVFSRVLSFRLAIGGIEGVRLGVGGLPVIMAGILFGPLAGGITGAVGDLVGFLISPIGPYMPHFTLTAALTGLIPGLVIKTVFNSRFSFGRLLVAVSSGQILTGLILVPYFLHSLFGHPYQATVLPALFSQLVNIPLYAFLLIALSRRLVAGDVLQTKLLSCQLKD